MKKLIFPILLILVVIGGAVGADFIKTRSDVSTSTKSAEAKHATPGKHKKASDKKKNSHSKKDKHGESSEYGLDTVNYLKFKRQFVVPVMLDGRIDALIIMNLNLILDTGAPENAYSFEPKLRDALTRELLGLSNKGLFGDGLTTAENYETVRETLLTASKAVMPDGVKDILILDIARQEY